MNEIAQFPTRVLCAVSARFPCPSALAALLAPCRMLLDPTGCAAAFAGHGRQPRQAQLSWCGKHRGTLLLTNLLHAFLLLKGYQCKLFSERIIHENIPLTFAYRLLSPRT